MEAEKLALSILKQVMEDKLDSTNVEVVVLTPVVDVGGVKRGKFHRLCNEELQALVTDL